MHQFTWELKGSWNVEASLCECGEYVKFGWFSSTLRSHHYIKGVRLIPETPAILRPLASWRYSIYALRGKGLSVGLGKAVKKLGRRNGMEKLSFPFS